MERLATFVKNSFENNHKEAGMLYAVYYLVGWEMQKSCVWMLGLVCLPFLTGCNGGSFQSKNEAISFPSKIASATVCSGTAAMPSTGVRAVPTFESVGLYFSNPGVAKDCKVQYRILGSCSWQDAYDMWYDSRYDECRGSIVSLAPNTTYEIQIASGTTMSRYTTVKTWSNSFPIAKTIVVPSGSSTLNISEGGSASTGYVVYDGKGATLDAANSYLHNVIISVPYVIIRGFNLVGAQADAIALLDGAHDIVIEDNDISGWGRFNYTNEYGWDIGVDMDSGVHGYCNNATTPLEHVVIQRNKIHNPRYGANSWSSGHPHGPQGITFSFCAGNHVIRHNEIYSSSDNQHHFNDAIGGEDNFTDAGFPNYDSDIYGNKLSETWDDAIESEGRNANVRIFGNYINNTATGVATTVVNRGPVYIYRNVYNRSRQLSEHTLDEDDRNLFAKSGDGSGFGGGRRFLFHNTVLQMAPPAGGTYSLGAGGGISGPASNQQMTNTVSRNNILQVWKTWWASADSVGGTGNDFDYDLYNGLINVGSAAEGSGIHDVPTYASGAGPNNEDGGNYALKVGSFGYDAGLRLANFNDDFIGNGPDIGAHEAGSPLMKFGVAASSGSATAGGSTLVTPTPTTTAPTPTTTPPSQIVYPSATMDASAYSLSFGATVNLTAHIFYNSTPASGVVSFTSDDSVISGCAAVVLSNGYAVCRTNQLVPGTHSIKGTYAGSGNFGSAVAGPIPITVTGSIPTLPTRFGMDSSSYSTSVGVNVTLTATIPGAGGVVAFKDNGSVISSCSSVTVSSTGYAYCVISFANAGAHAITGNYSGNGSYVAGVAGPITVSVVGSTASLPSRFGMDSSNYSPNAGASVTLTATIPGIGGTVSFRDNGNVISSCSAVTVNSSGVATCNMSFGSGSHAITGNYSGNGSYVAGVAGPITLTVR